MRFILISFLAACIFLVACKSSTDTAKTDTPADGTTVETMPTTPDAPTMTTTPAPGQSTPTTNAQEVVVPPPPAKSEPAQNAQGVWHFTCPKGCKGGGGAVGPCGKCGTTLTHNAAYHAGATPPPTQPQGGNITVPTTASATPVPAPTQKAPEPPQNAKGVWHFTCSKGCAGGGGTASPCGKCGATLVHNAAYHQ